MYFEDILWQWNSGNLFKMGWSSTEDLLCVQDDGNVLVYDVFGTYMRTITMGQVQWYMS